MFPLNAVAFPGATVRLNVFEDRYRALVEHVLSQPQPERLFGITAIREGYEVGAHGVQSLHTTGTLMQLVEASRTHDGRFEIEAVVMRSKPDPFPKSRPVRLIIGTRNNENATAIDPNSSEMRKMPDRAK